MEELPIQPKFSSLPQMLDSFDAAPPRMAFKATNAASMAKWQAELAAELKRLIGYNRFEPSPPLPQITEEIQCQGYTRQRVILHTEPNVLMPVYVLIPDSAGAAGKAVIAVHGHGGGGKAAVVGKRDNPEIAQAIAKYHYDYGLQLVRKGYTVFCPDARGFGERREASIPGVLDSSCEHLNHMGLPLGRTVLGMWVWDLHRLIDYIQTREDCDPDNIGCVGLSGGGMQTLWASALDDRIACAVVSGYFYGYRQALLEMYQNCSCNYVPHLFETANIEDIAALIASRPLLIETGDQDPLNGAGGLANVLAPLAILRRAYDLHGAGDRLAHHVFHGEHRWDGAVTPDWLDRFLKRS